MSLPKHLIHSFEQIKSSPIIFGNITKDTVQLFVDILNNAIPSPMNPVAYTIYRFNRSKYIANKERFLNDIKNFKPYDAMILWTDFKDILSFFNLEGKIFLGWDKKNNKYRGFIISPEINEKPLPQIQILRKGETLSGIATAMDNEMDQVYNYMHERIAAIQKQLNGE